MHNSVIFSNEIFDFSDSSKTGKNNRGLWSKHVLLNEFLTTFLIQQKHRDLKTYTILTVSKNGQKFIVEKKFTKVNNTYYSLEKWLLTYYVTLLHVQTNIQSLFNKMYLFKNVSSSTSHKKNSVFILFLPDG